MPPQGKLDEKLGELAKKKETRLLRSQSVLESSEHIGNVVRFMHSDRGMPGGSQSENRVYIMDERDWKEFGEPQTITVTVEPGDTLNV